MKTLSMALKNLKKNFSFYTLYLLSVSLVITVYFAFRSFSMNHVMLEKISELVIGAGALIVGLVLGAVMHKGIVYGTTILLDLSINNEEIPFFHFPAVLNTVIFILLVVFVMVLSNARFLIKSHLMDLVRFEKSAEKVLKFKRMPAILGFVLTAAGYALALDILRGADSFWISFGFYPTGLLTTIFVVSGTVLFIASFLPYAVQKSKKNKKAFYTETRIITAPNFIYRIRSNAKTLIMLTLLSAATLTITSVMALSLYYPIAAVSRIAPSELEFRIENEGQVKNVKQIVRKYDPDGTVIFTRTDIFKVTATGERLPMEYSVGTSKGDSDNENILREEGFECISYSQYLSLLKAQKREDAVKELSGLKEDECILVKYQPNPDGSQETGSIYSLNMNGHSVPLTVKDTTLNNPVSFANSVGTMIVSDHVIEQIKAGDALKISVLSINAEVIKDNEKLFGEIKSSLGNTPYLQGYSHRVSEIIAASSSTFLLIGFLVVLFFIATGSILYFNNISAVSDSKADYEILRKMGYSDRKLKKIIRKQVLTFFCIPFLFGLTDCIFATIVYKTGLMQNLLGDTMTLYLPAVTAAAMTALIYFVYYCLTVRTCYKTILRL